MSSYRRWQTQATGRWMISPVPLVLQYTTASRAESGRWRGNSESRAAGRQDRPRGTPASSIFRFLVLCAQCELELLCFLKIRWQSVDYLEPTVGDADLNNAASRR